MTFEELIASPLGATVLLEEHMWQRLADRFFETGEVVRNLLVSQETGAFLRGLARTHNIPDDQVPKMALGVLYVVLGEWPMANLAAGLSSTMGLPNDKAQQVATEIEKELFAPIMGELQTFWAKQRQPKAGAQAQQAGATNVIDLKHKSQNTEHKQPPKPSFQIKKGPPLPRPGEFRT